MSDDRHDGIEELDNQLPKWWLYLFYLTIVFAAGYFAYYSLGSGPTLRQEYERVRNEEELASLAKSASVKVASEEELRALLKSSERVHAGQGIFQARCVACHGSAGQGGIGPNLPDDYWLHGGKMTEIVHTVTQGVADKGMPPWGPLLSQDEVHSLAAFIKSIRGTHPPNPKAPQGELYKE
ncbi:MAG: cbb3-type cytochrome c oxidase N-terminal domain-containing protein [Bdellovibrionota bacterium]